MNKNETKKKNASRRRILAIIAIITAALLCAAVALYFILSAAAKKEIETDYEFAEPDWSLTVDSIMAEPEYSGVGWFVTYTNEFGESITILDDDYLKYGIGVELMSYYFAAVQSGDDATYNSLFGDQYRAANGDHAPFTPQRIYDIKVALISRQTDDAGGELICYRIEYKIMRNDGTFNRLIGSDMSRPQYVYIRASSDDVYIERVETQGRG